MPDGKKTNLTAKLKVKFFNEDYDSPSDAAALRVSRRGRPDGKFVLRQRPLRHLEARGRRLAAENLTKIGREQKIRFRSCACAAPRTTPSRTAAIDLSKPLLLGAENLHTRDTGFYRLEPGGTPKMLVMGARALRHADEGEGRRRVPAHGADVLRLPRLLRHRRRTSTRLKRVTDINPQVKEFNWGKAELVHYKSTDGVAAVAAS